MSYQVTNFKDNSVKVISDPIELRQEILFITEDVYEAQDVLVWATTPVYGGFKYDHPDFEIVIIGAE